MMSLESNRSMGGVGALLVAIAPASMGPFGGFLGLAGLILILIALNGFANDYKERKIFDNALYGTLAAIVGVVAGIAVILVTAFTTLSRMGISWTDWSSWSQMGTMFMSPANMGNLWGLIGGIIIGLVVLFAFAIVAAIFFRKSLNALAEKTKVGMFGTAGMLMLVGAALTIILVGFLLIWISFIMVAVAFFSIKTK